MSDVVRHEYRALSDDEKAQVQTLKDIGLSFIQLCDAIGQSLRTLAGKDQRRASGHVGGKGGHGMTRLRTRRD